MIRRSRSLFGFSAVVLAASFSLSGCSGVGGFSALTVSAADDAANPDCAKIMLAMPTAVGQYQQRETTSQGTTAYGDPSVTIVRCGVKEIQVTNDPCVSVNDMDWISTQDKDNPDTWVFTSYGRKPTIEVVIDNKKIASSTVLVDMSNIMKKMPSNGHQCLSSKDINLKS